MASDRLRLFILAGETSGDRIAADLVRRLRQRRPVELTGVGGGELAAEGLASLYPMSDLSVMGVSDVLKRLPLLLWRLRQTVAAIRRAQPDVVVLVDSQVFSATIARRLRRKGYAGPLVLYVSPAFWAWRPQRAAELKPLFDEVLAVLPFEPAAMQRMGGPPAHYVGHPALRRFAFRNSLPEAGPLLLLPGSRRGEIDRSLPMMRAVAERLASHARVTGFVIPTPTAQLERMKVAVASWPMPVDVVAGDAAVRDAFARAVAAIAVSGTVTLELAAAGVPTILTYVADAAQARGFLQYKVKFIGLPNIILDRQVIPEMLFTEPQPEKLADAAAALLDDPEAMAAQLAAFAEIRALMEKGAPEAPLEDPADRVLAVLAAGAQRSMIGV